MKLPQGVPTILGAVMSMALTDAIIKQVSAGMSLWQIWVLRSALVLPVLFLMARGKVGAGPWVIARTGALVAMYFCMYPVLPFIDLSLAGAAFYTAPLFILGLSALVLGNRVTWRHAAAVLAGFAGLLVIVRPFAASFTPLVFGPVGAAACYAVAAIVTRARCTHEPNVVLAFWLNAAFLVLGLVGLSVPKPALDFPFLTAPWQAVTPALWGTMAVLAALILAITLGVAKAYKTPHPEIIATFDYCYMIFAIFWGYVFFAETPDLWTLLGMAMITGSGIGILWADGHAGTAGRAKRQQKAPAL